MEETGVRGENYRPKSMHPISVFYMYKDKEVNKNVKNIFLSMCDVKVLLTFTSLNLVLL